MIVLDASAVLEVLLRTAQAPRIEERILGHAEALHAPHLLDVEVAHVLRRYTARQEISESQGRAALEVFEAFPLTRHAHTSLLRRAWMLRDNLTAYDAMYIALAEALEAPLITRDSRLRYAPGHKARIEVV